MEVKEYIVAETSKEELARLITEFFGEDYGTIVQGSDWTNVYRKDFPLFSFELPCKTSGSNTLYAGTRQDEESAWTDLGHVIGSCIKIRFYKEEGLYIYMTGITRDNTEYAGCVSLIKSSCFIYNGTVYYGYRQYFSPATINVDNYLSLAPFFNPHETKDNPDYTNIYIGAMRPYTTSNYYLIYVIDGVKYAKVGNSIFIKIEE